MSLSEVKQKTSASEFVLWMEYLEWEINAFDKNAHYLAQIAAEVRRSYVSKPTSVKIEDFIMKFSAKEEKPEASANEQQRSDVAKKFFFGLTGLLGGVGKKGKKL